MSSDRNRSEEGDSLLASGSATGGQGHLSINDAPSLALRGNSSFTEPLPKRRDTSGTTRAAKKSSRVALEAAKRLVFLSSGSLLPTCSDKVRNNIKSRGLLISVYIHAAAIVAMLVILVLTGGETTNSTKMHWAVPPSAKASLGVPMPSFAVSITDDYHQPQVGRKILLSLTPIKPLPLWTVMPNGAEVKGRTVDCIQSRFPGLGTNTIHSQVDNYLCSAMEPPLLHNHSNAEWPVETVTNSLGVTDEFGVATFSNVTLSIGSPVEYLIVLATVDDADVDEVKARERSAHAAAEATSSSPTTNSEDFLVVFSFVTFEASVVDIDVTSTANEFIETEPVASTSLIEGGAPTTVTLSATCKKFRGNECTVLKGPLLQFQSNVL